MPFSIANGNALLAGLFKPDLRTLMSRLLGAQFEAGRVLHDWGQPALKYILPTSTACQSMQRQNMLERMALLPRLKNGKLE